MPSQAVFLIARSTFHAPASRAPRPASTLCLDGTLRRWDTVPRRVERNGPRVSRVDQGGVVKVMYDPALSSCVDDDRVGGRILRKTNYHTLPMSPVA